MQRGERFRLILIGLLAVLAPLAYGLSRMQYASARYGPVAAQYWSRPWFLLAGGASAAFLILVAARLISARRRIQVHQNGLTLARPGRKTLYWNEISGVASGITTIHFFGLPLREVQRATLYPVVGRPFHLHTPTENLPELLTRVKAALYPRLLPEMEGLFSAGKRVYFGPISISPRGLRLEDNHSPTPGEKNSREFIWSQVQHIGIQNGLLAITLQGGNPIRMPASSIPNLELMLQIIQSGVKK